MIVSVLFAIIGQIFFIRDEEKNEGPYFLQGRTNLEAALAV